MIQSSRIAAARNTGLSTGRFREISLIQLPLRTKATLVVNPDRPIIQDKEFDFPYLFLNKEEVLSPRVNSSKKLLNLMTTYIDYNAKGEANNFKKMFVQAYITLLKSIASNETQDLE